MRKDKSRIALIDNNILDKSLYIGNVDFWEIKELNLTSDQGGEEIKIIKATKTFLNSQNKEAFQVIEARDRLPDHKDNAVLFALISMAQEQNSYTIKTSYYQIIEKVKWSVNANKYAQVKESLKVWHNLKIMYKNCFYTHKTGHINFSTYIITSIEEHETDKKLIIQFEPRFLDVLIKNKFFTGIRLNSYSKLSSGFQRRLYEILSKSFNNNLTFEINWEKLRKKVEDTSKHKSVFMRKLNRAIKSLNEKTDLKIEVKVFDNTIIFRLTNEEKAKLFNLIWHLETYKDKLGIDDNFLLLLKNKCTVKEHEKGKNFYLICKDPQLKEIIDNNKHLRKMLSVHRIDFII